LGDISPRDLAGSWKLVSIKTEIADTKEIVDIFGPDPLGYGVFTVDGRWIVIITASGLSEPDNDQQRATTYDALGAYSGRYMLTGNQLTIKVDVASNPGVIGREQIRFAELDGDRLVLTTPRDRLRRLQGREGIGIVVWERETLLHG
jgi:lipocalin-like protein